MTCFRRAALFEVKYVAFLGEGHLPAGAMALIEGIQFAWPRRP